MITGRRRLDRATRGLATTTAVVLVLLIVRVGAGAELESFQPSSGQIASVPPGDSQSEIIPEAQVANPSAKPMFQLRGRIDADAIWAHQSPANIADFGKLEDVVGLRRARVGLQGHLTEDFRYVSEIDLATGKVVVRDCFVAHTGTLVSNSEFRLGHFREPFSLEGGTSANVFPFMERSSINNLDPARNWGIGFYRHDECEVSTFAIGLFHAGTDPSDFQGGDGADTALTTRCTVLPWEMDEGFLHFGMAASFRIPDRNVVVIGQGPSSPLLDFQDSSTSPFVATLVIPAESQQLLNMQSAYLRGPWLTQAEWYGTWIDQIGGGQVFLHGSYVQSSYFLTGEHREYLRKDGLIGGIKVDRPVTHYFADDRCGEALGFGAWEVTARFAYLDYADPNLPLGPLGQLEGVRLSQATFGVNWYLADRLRLMFNYSYAVPDEPNAGSSAASIFATRLAMYW